MRFAKQVEESFTLRLRDYRDWLALAAGTQVPGGHENSCTVLQQALLLCTVLLVPDTLQTY